MHPKRATKKNLIRRIQFNRSFSYAKRFMWKSSDRMWNQVNGTSGKLFCNRVFVVQRK